MDCVQSFGRFMFQASHLLSQPCRGYMNVYSLVPRSRAVVIHGLQLLRIRKRRLETYKVLEAGDLASGLLGSTILARQLFPAQISSLGWMWTMVLRCSGGRGFRPVVSLVVRIGPPVPLNHGLGTQVGRMLALAAAADFSRRLLGGHRRRRTGRGKGRHGGGGDDDYDNDNNNGDNNNNNNNNTKSGHEARRLCC